MTHAPPPLRFRGHIAVIAAVLVFAAATPAQITLTERNTIALPAGATAPELSGLTYISGDQWRAVSDSANTLADLTIALDTADGSITAASATTATLGGTVHDNEGIAYHAAWGTLLVSTEEATPSLREYDATTLAETAASPYATPAAFGSGNTRSNLGFESLTLNPAGTRLYTANEEALTIDGPTATDTAGTLVRIVEYTLDPVTAGSATPDRQFAYAVDPVHGPNAAGATRDPVSGLVDLVALPDGSLLTLERSVYWSPFLGSVELPNFELRIYHVDPADGVALSNPDDPLGAGPATLSKTLLWSKDSSEGAENMEGLALGPATDGGWSVIGVTDNQGTLQTKLTAFELVVPEPGSAAIGIATLGLLALRSRGGR